MAGATAFFFTFALPPILIILVQLFSLFLSRRLVGSEIMQVLTDTLGRASAEQIRETTRGFRTLASNWVIAVLGFFFLVFVATTLFSVIKNTLNDIWKIRTKDRPGVLVSLHLRARALAVILLAGLLFLAGIFMNGVEVLAGDILARLGFGGGVFVKGLIRETLGLITVTLWFIVLFRYLADARPSWKVSIIGGILTGVLFSIGKAGLSFLMLRSNIGSIYGASGSMVLLLLFVFYSSFILYFGASFIKMYAEELHEPLRPIHKAFRYQLKKVN